MKHKCVQVGPGRRASETEGDEAGLGNGAGAAPARRRFCECRPGGYAVALSPQAPGVPSCLCCHTRPSLSSFLFLRSHAIVSCRFGKSPDPLGLPRPHLGSGVAVSPQFTVVRAPGGACKAVSPSARHRSAPFGECCVRCNPEDPLTCPIHRDRGARVPSAHRHRN